MTQPLHDFARAKINLTLRVLGRRIDGYHLLDSLVAFADCADELTLTPDLPLSLKLDGPFSAGLESGADNLVLKAVGHLAQHLPGLRTGRFHLTKNLPVASGIGGGSSDAAAALRLLARLNDFAMDHPILIAAARASGADVPVCLAARSMRMQGIGETLTPQELPAQLPAVLINPGIGVSTRDVFARLGLAPGQITATPRVWALAGQDRTGQKTLLDGQKTLLDGPERLLQTLISEGNDMCPPAQEIAPVIGATLSTLRASGALFANMSGSGATVFGLYQTLNAAHAAAQSIRQQHPAWWIMPTLLG